MLVANPRVLWSRLAVGGVAAALVVGRAWTLAAAPPTDFDDAYMFVRHADNLRGGFGLVWNRGGEPVYGATGLLHLGLVTLARALWPAWPDFRALASATLVAAAVALAIAAAIVSRFATHPWLRGAPERALVAVVAAVAYSEAFVFHCGTGMDTMSAVAAIGGVVWAALALAARPTPRAAAVCALVGWIAIAARPDGALVAAGMPLLAVAFFGGGRRRPALAACFVAPLSALVGASLLAKQHWLGTALPLAFWANRPFAYAVNQVMGHLGRFYFPSLPAPVAAAAVVSDGDMSGSITITDSITRNNPRGTFETPGLPGFYVIASGPANIVNSTIQR